MAKVYAKYPLANIAIYNGVTLAHYGLGAAGAAPLRRVPASGLRRLRREGPLPQREGDGHRLTRHAV